MLQTIFYIPVAAIAVWVELFHQILVAGFDFWEGGKFV
jgi:hypothetical protein